MCIYINYNCTVEPQLSEIIENLVQKDRIFLIIYIYIYVHNIIFNIIIHITKNIHNMCMMLIE